MAVKAENLERMCYFDEKRKKELAFLFPFWIKNPRQEPLSSLIATDIWKICEIAQKKFFPDCPFNDQHDLVSDIFYTMWKNLPNVYSEEKNKEQVNFVWLLNRARLYATGAWSIGYGNIGCKYTTAAKRIALMKTLYDEEMINEDSVERPDAHPHKVNSATHYFG